MHIDGDSTGQTDSLNKIQIAEKNSTQQLNNTQRCVKITYFQQVIEENIKIFSHNLFSNLSLLVRLDA